MSSRPSVLFCLLLCGVPLYSQQAYVGRFDIYHGYSFLSSPHISLAEHGYHFQAGVNPVMWCSLGFDYSRTTGNSALLPGMMISSVQEKLGAQLGQLSAAGMLPSGYSLSVPFDSVTQTFAAGR